MNNIDGEFYRFLNLLGVVIQDNTNITPLVDKYWNFKQFAHLYPENIFELNFIKWQHSENGPHIIPSTPPPAPEKVLQSKTITTLPLKLQKLKNQINQPGKFINLTFQQPEQTKTRMTVETVVEEKCNSGEDDTIQAISDLVTYLDWQIDQPNIFEQAMPSITPPNIPTTHGRGKDITLAKHVFQDEQEQPTSPTQSKKLIEKPSRKRKRETERLSGRPTKDEVLIRMDEDDDDMATLQLSRRELILPNSEGVCKKSKTILTKLKRDITVSTQKQFMTYELFAETRRKALDVIRENRELLEKINAAEFVLTSLLKKQSEN
jgi:hypothetical protein